MTAGVLAQHGSSRETEIPGHSRAESFLVPAIMILQMKALLLLSLQMEIPLYSAVHTISLQKALSGYLYEMVTRGHSKAQYCIL